MCHWSTSLVILSVVLAVGISFVALLLTFYFRQDTSPWSWPKVVSAVLMGAAIPVMHYTGMAAASFTPSASAMGQWNQAYAVSAESLSAAAVSIVTFMVLGLAVVTSLVDRRFAAQGVELEASRRYREIVESAFDAFIGIDSNGVIIDWNAQAEATFGWFCSEAIGQSLSRLIIPERYREAHEKGLSSAVPTAPALLLLKPCALCYHVQSLKRRRSFLDCPSSERWSRKHQFVFHLFGFAPFRNERLFHRQRPAPGWLALLAGSKPASTFTS